MDTIFMSSENGKTSKPHLLTLKLTNTLDLKLDNKVIAISIIIYSVLPKCFWQNLY